ncbi:hypothetical protein TNCV_1741591 [Trichonephila clavipes]|uniref:Transposase n=1 Tax=Trichonephila clavipes TaxID=2585209 RepID=A0A8X6RGQ4_TRICX|nr:hypothetical protein TNCV_1741591 [Trichonephila clavipes]
MSSRYHIDDFMRGRIIAKIEEGRKITDVARAFDIAHSVVSRLSKSFKTTGMCSRRHGEVVYKIPYDVCMGLRYIVLSAKSSTGAHSSSRWQISFLLPHGKQISRKTVARHLKGRRTHGSRPVVCVPLTEHRTVRLQ